MASELGAELPDALLALLAGGPLELEGIAFGLLTTGDDGWPHQALLSAGEVLAVDAHVLRLALWPGSRAARNLAASGRGVLCVVQGGAVYAVHLAVGDGSALVPPDAATLVAFEAAVVRVRCDVAPYAAVEHGVRFRLHDREPVIARWVATRAALTEAMLHRFTM